MTKESRPDGHRMICGSGWEGLLGLTASDSLPGCRPVKMKTYCTIFLLLLMWHVCTAVAQEFDNTEPRWKQLSQAYGFVVVQRALLELIESKFPDLAKETKEAWFAFESSAFGESVKGLEVELAKELGDRLPEFKEELRSQMDDLLPNQSLSSEQATAFLAEVTARSKGQLPETIRSTLLSVHPRYSENPALELAEGWKQTFQTKDHPKAKGVDFSVSVPASWSRGEGYRPNIIQVFRSRNGHGPIVCTLLVKTLPLPAGYKLTKSESKDLFQPGALNHLIPEGSTFIEGKEIVLEGAPAGMIVWDTTAQRLDVTLTMRVTLFVTVCESSMIFLQFGTPEMPDAEEPLDELQARFLPTYMATANTLVLNDLYK